ncbi:MAG: 2-(1,2-epoxy-1,2-dihydrophenyl)acetyl-CoA isomerase [Phycisphaerae bacterium]|jgi:2-(1,2-epoxy-1,2-dihydrophenyl)acetyl-CoA isomerase|nr:2-(1,2-epoxy-1,2-dihydrophenyl)acetyl-CoA isomerase [Phycisphaerae bacterium]
MTTSTSTFETINVTIEEGICTISLNRSEVLNAFNDTLTTELTKALKDAARNQEVRVVVLTGSGRAFSSGQDLGELKEKYVPGHVPNLGEDLKKRYDPIVKTIHTMEKPTIASVNGVAAGAGCSLALACDLRIASEHASFIEVFVNVGLIPDSGSTWTLPRLIGFGRAMELCLTGRPVKAEEALSIGLVNQVVSSDELEEATHKLAQRLSSMPGKALSLTKRLLSQSFENDFKEQLAQEAFAQETAGKTHDHFEGVLAFIEKRKPNFTHE